MVSLDMPCGYTSELPRQSVMRIGLRCLNFTSRNQLLDLELLPRDPSTRRRSRFFPIRRQRRCACGSQTWRGGLGRLIAREQSTLMEASSRTRGQALNTGRFGTDLKSNMEMKTLSRYAFLTITY